MNSPERTPPDSRSLRNEAPDGGTIARSRRRRFARAAVVTLVSTFALRPLVREAWAQDAAARLRSFIEGTQSAQARFTQTVIDRKGRRVQEATGIMQFLRPGRFRWEYEKPYSQLLVGDGQRIWIWDRDLNQVTVRRLDRAITGTPAALLAGSNEIEKAFTVTVQPAQDGLEWIEAVPKGNESTFASVRLGFAQDVLAAMELNDALGSRTMIRFEDLQRNPKLSLQLFRFTPPKGADVLEDK